MVDLRPAEQHLDDKSIEKRADYLTEEELGLWNVETEFLNLIQKELLNSYPRLFAGPRGTGKTHQMRLAHIKCKNEKELPYSVFVSFNNYYHLEPLIIKTSNAVQIFHTWVLAKISFSAICELEESLKKEVEILLDIKLENMESFIYSAEKGIFDIQHDQIIQTLSINKVVELINFLMKKNDRKRAILLLDDAAYTLTHTYMIEFFEIFRSLKSTKIAPKASVYPGTTQYGPRFHLWQDADPVIVWERFDNEMYLSFLNKFIDLRLAEYVREIPNDILDVFKYISFGIPRSFISLISFYNRYRKETKSSQSSINSTVELLCELMKQEYLSLTAKIPQYESTIKTGLIFFEKIIDDVSKENSKEDTDELKIVLGLEKITDLTQKRMIDFLVEAGLLYDVLGSVKHGEERQYERYVPHVAFLFRERAFNRGRGFSASETIATFKKKEAKHPIRRKIETILGDQLKDIKLNLPACSYCNEGRLTTSQKYCHNCGKELKDFSSYEKCMEIPVAELPLTPWQKERLANETNIRTVRDFLVSPNVSGELQKAYGIGRVRSLTIYTSVLDFIKEYLS